MFYGITTLATNYLFNSNEVSYDNTETGLHADEVQGAIDEVFQHATDYSELKNKIGTNALTTTAQTLTGGINELKTNVTSLNEQIAKVAVLTDTFPNAVGAKQLSYPTGFDASNTYVLSLMVRHDSVWYSRMEATSAAVYLTDAGIFAYNGTPGWVNDTFRIMIGRK